MPIPRQLSGEIDLEGFSKKSLLSLLTNVYEGKVDDTANIFNVEHLLGAMTKGYGKHISMAKYDSIDYSKLVHLEKNVYQFCGAKNWQMMKDLTLLTKDQDKIRPFNEFKKLAGSVLNDYQGTYLRAEYNAAIAGAQMASKWVDVEKTAQNKSMDDILLQYRTAEDGRVRDAHKALNRITRPASDPMWNTYYPPNGWNCRCTVVKLNRGDVTSEKKRDESIGPVEIPKIFATNLGKEGLVFPKNSPYYIGLPDGAASLETANRSTQRNVMFRYAQANLKNAICNTVIGKVQFNMTGVRKILQQPHDHYFEKNMLLYNITDILENSEFHREAKNKDDPTRMVYWLKSTINNHQHFFMIEEAEDRSHVLYTIQDKNKHKEN